MAQVREASDGSGGDGLARIAALEADNAALRARIAELESDLARVKAELGPPETDGYARCSRGVLASVLEGTPNVIFVKDLEGRFILANAACIAMSGVTRDEYLGRTDHDFFPPDVADFVRARDQAIIDGGVPVQFEESFPLHDETIYGLTIKFPIFDEEKRCIGICGIGMDITEKKRAEIERDTLREQMLVAQQENLRELSTPLMPIADGVLAMPLVGRIDEIRAARVMDALLDAITRESPHTAILDVTGVRDASAQVADALVAAGRAARLLGVQVLLSGLRPEMAKTLVELGAGLGDIKPFATLKAAVAYALGQGNRGALGKL